MTAPISAHLRGHDRNSTHMHDFCSQPLNKVAFASRLQRSHRRRRFDPRSNILTRSWSPEPTSGSSGGLPRMNAQPLMTLIQWVIDSFRCARRTARPNRRRDNAAAASADVGRPACPPLRLALTAQRLGNVLDRNVGLDQDRKTARRTAVSSRLGEPLLIFARAAAVSAGS